MEPSAVIAAILKAASKPLKERLSRSDRAVRVLRSLGIDPEHPPEDYSGVYAYALVEYALGPDEEEELPGEEPPPEEALKIFRHPEVKSAFRRAFETGEGEAFARGANAAIGELTESGKLPEPLPFDLREEVERFATAFHRIVDRTRSPSQVRVERRVEKMQESVNDVQLGLGLLSEDVQEIKASSRLLAEQADADEADNEASKRDESAGPTYRPVESQTTETLYSTMLPVVRMPRYIYAAPSPYHSAGRDEVRMRIQRPSTRSVLYPYIFRSEMLFCFNDLTEPGNPFEGLIEGGVERFELASWTGEPDRERMLQNLLGRALNKHTGRRNLNLDKRHKRYYFMPHEKGAPRKEIYRPLHKKDSKKSVVWQPETRATGLPKNYWLHRAVSLRFERVGSQSWMLTLRPEFHVTKDSVEPFPSEEVGSKVTRQKSRMYNDDLLTELQFWRYYLADGKPRFDLYFGGSQRIVVSSKRFLSAEITWPGVPEERAKAFANAEYEEDLFSDARRRRLERERHDEESFYES